MIDDAEINDELEEDRKKYEEVANKVTEFTTLFNKHNLDYEVKSFDDGTSIHIGDTIIDFYLAGAIVFNVDDVKFVEKENDNSP